MRISIVNDTGEQIIQPTSVALEPDKDNHYHIGRLVFRAVGADPDGGLLLLPMKPTNRKIQLMFYGTTSVGRLTVCTSEIGTCPGDHLAWHGKITHVNNPFHDSTPIVSSHL
jgi:hypothetical protein